MQAIETIYNGYKFRSRLEARWAVFFNELKVEFQYEPEGFTDGANRYLPDFFLPQTFLRSSKGVYVEIKPEIFNEGDELDWFKNNLVLFKGEPNNSIWGNYDKPDCGIQLVPYWDNEMKFWICANCNTSKIEYSESNYNYCPCCNKGGCNDDLINSAAIAARSARFEFGESGSTIK